MLNNLCARVTATAVTAAAATLALLAVGGGASAASSPVPYTDSAANGGLGLCSAAGQPITTGNINAAPFVTSAIGADPPPPAYQVAGAKGTLYAYQPRQGVDPGEWSGEILTGSSTYSDPQHPAAKGTVRDNSLAFVISALPPGEDGFYELRLTYSGPNRPAFGAGYAAADIKVTGDTWQLVDGTSPSCSEKVTSGEETIPGFVTPASSPAIIPAYINGSPNPRAFPHGVPTISLAPFVNPDDQTPSPIATPPVSAPPSVAVTSAAPTLTPTPPQSAAPVAPVTGSPVRSAAPALATGGIAVRSATGGSFWTVFGGLQLIIIAGAAFVWVRRLRRAL